MPVHHLPSRFMSKTLLPEEKLVADAQFPFFYTVSCYFTLAACTLLGIAAQYGLKYHVAPHLPFRLPVDYRILPGAGLFLGLWQFFWMMLRKWSTEIVLTDQRLIYKRGFFTVHIEEVDIEQLASDNVEQTFLGRLFDYGQIHIRCIEASDIWLPPVSGPYVFRNAIEQQKHLYRDTYMKTARLRQHGMNAGDK
jgi:hypothetical protein